MELLVLIPLLLVVVSVLIGWPVAAVIFSKKEEVIAWAALTGVIIVMLAITNASYFGFPVRLSGVPILGGLLILSLLFSNLIIKRKKGKSLFFKSISISQFYFLIPFIIAYLIHILPIIANGQLITIGLNAGDLPTYTALGDWLVDHPITQKVIVDSTWNPVLAAVKIYQDRMFRIGVLHLFSLILSITGLNSLELFTVFSAIGVGFQSIAVWIFSFHLSKKSVVFATLSASVYALHPLLQWSAFAAFLPQGFGVTIMLLFISYLHFFEMNKGQGIKYLLFLGFLVTAEISAYNELIPILLAITFLILLIKYIKKSLSPFQIVLIIVAISLVPIVFYPIGTISGVQGMINQIKGVAHGGMQEFSSLALLGVLYGLVAPPITPDRMSLIRLENILVVFISSGCLIGTIFVLRNYVNKHINHLLSVVCLIFGSLMMYVTIRYDVAIMRNWNCFKVMQYGAPIVLPLLLYGLQSFYIKYKKVAILLALIFFVPYSWAQVDLFSRVFLQAEVLKPEKEISKWAASNPEARIYLGDFRDSSDNHVILSSLNESAVLSSSDSVGTGLAEGTYYSKIFTHILTYQDFVSKYKGKVVLKTGRYALIDVKNEDMLLPFIYGQTKEGNGELIAKVSRDGHYDLLIDCASIPQEISFNINGQNTLSKVKQPYDQIVLKRIKLKKGLNLVKYLSSNSIDFIVTNLEISTDINRRQTKFEKTNIGIPHIKKWSKVEYDSSSKVQVTETNDNVLLTAKNPSDGGIYQTVHLEKGRYLLKLTLGKINIERSTPNAKGAYIGEQGVAEKCVALTNAQSGKEVWVPLFVEKEKDVPIAIGIGGWGSAQGVLELRNLEVFQVSRLVKREEVPFSLSDATLKTFNGSKAVTGSNLFLSSPDYTDSFWTIPVNLGEGTFVITAKPKGNVEGLDEPAKVVLVGQKKLIGWTQHEAKLALQKQGIFTIDKPGRYEIGVGIGGWGQAKGNVIFQQLKLQRITSE